MLGKAIAIASKAFENKTDKGGSPYILHCLWVMNQVRHLGEKHMIVAVLHDLLEDTDWTAEDLIKQGFSLECVVNISLLTHRPGMSYDDYIQGISGNPIARAVKAEGSGAQFAHHTIEGG